jgi:hypothetical protein
VPYASSQGALRKGVYQSGLDEEERHYLDGRFNVLNTGRLDPSDTR